MTVPVRPLTVAEGAAASLFAAGLAIALTWPQALHMATSVAAHADPYFSMWRLAWVAHALSTQPLHLFDANIFHPETRTLAYSDATLLEGLVAAPFLWGGASPVLVHNCLLLTGIAGSGLAMFVLARHVTASTGAALAATAIFELAPYRVEHFMHLELQWTMWMPLTFWSLHRAFGERAWRFGALAGVFVSLQILSSIYYGLFLAMASGVFVVAMAAARPREALRAVPALAIGGLVAAAIALPYSAPYFIAADTVGSRPTAEIAAYSARLTSYLASPPQSVWWGWTADRWGSAELRLFPGLTASILALAGIFARPQRVRLVYAAVAIVAIELSLGLNGRLYPWLTGVIEALEGLRAPSRFAILAMVAIAVLGALAVRMLEQAMERAGLRPGAAASALVVALMLLESRHAGMSLERVRGQPPEATNVYLAARSRGPGVAIELPLPRLDALPGREPLRSFWSIGSWLPRVNGYSGYYPPSYARTVVTLEAFPDARSVAYLRNLNVRYVIVHKSEMQPEQYGSLLFRMAENPDLAPVGTLEDPEGEAALFVLEP